MANVAGSWVYEKYGGRTLFRVAGVGGVVWLLVLFVFFHIVPLMKRRYSLRNECSEKECSI